MAPSSLSRRLLVQILTSAREARGEGGGAEPEPRDDRPAELERLTRLAARATGAEAAVLWLSGERGHHVASAYGLGSRPQPSLPMEALASGDVAFLGDAAGEGWARAALLAPVVEGEARLGVLAVFDPRPRAWTDAEREALADHASIAGELCAASARLAEQRLALDGFPGALVMCDRAMRVTLAAGSEATRHGFAALVGKTVREAADPRAAVYAPLLGDALAGIAGTSEIGADDGAYEIAASPLVGAGGSVTGAFMVVHDVSARGAAQAAHRASEQRYAQLFEKAGEAIYIVEADGDRAGVILEANVAAAAMYGYAVDELRGMTEADLKAPEEQDVTARRIHCIGGVNWIEGEALHVRRDGTRFPVAFSAGPLDVGAERFVLVFARDITESRRTEQALRDATRAADAASRAKSAFLANMSHEIRTPMNAVLGYAQLLCEDPVIGADQRQHLDMVLKSGEHLLALINDVLELSKLEVGHRKPAREDVDLAGLLDEIDRIFRPRAAQKRLSFEVVSSPELPRAVLGDASKLRQVLVNLVGNAVKFTERGGVRVALKVRRRATRTTLVVDVEDTGPGIGADKLSGLFQPFGQVRVGIVAQGGTGLGLALSRELARAMGGDVTVESCPGEGSVFRFQVPFEPGSPSRTQRPPPRGPVVGIAGQAGLVRILVADAADGDRVWARSVLERVGFDVREAQSGAEAVAAFASYRPHLVLIDAHATDADGASAVRAIRRRPAGGKAVVVALVSSGAEQERDSMVEGGADGVLQKPLREEDLLEVVRHQLGIDYSYEVALPGWNTLPPAPPPLGSAPVGALPEELSTEIALAAHVADYDRLLELVEQITPRQADVASALRALVERYAYAEIEAFLSEPAPGRA